MRCPTDDTVLQLSERAGVEIDYCPSCRGVWLDRGELDRIIDRSATTASDPHVQRPQSGSPRSDPAPRQDPSDRDRGRSQWDDDRYDDDRERPRKRRGSFLGDLLDI